MVSGNLESTARRSAPLVGGAVSHTMFDRAMCTVQRAFCALRGHDSLLHFDHNRVCLLCPSCGYETPGWQIDGTPPQIRFHGDPGRRLVAVRLMETRKVA